MGINKKKAGHFSENEAQNVKKDKRGVLSFEELPLDEYEKQDKKKKTLKLDKKRIIIAVAILVLLVLSVLVYFNRGFLNFGGGNSGGNNFSASVSGSAVEAGNFRLMSGNLFYCSDTSMVCLDKDGEEQYSIQHGFAKPVLKTADDKAIVYNLGSVEFSVLDNDGVVFSNEMSDNIYLADIASNGNYAFVTSIKDYNAKFFALSSGNTLKYTYSFADYYITAMALNGDATGAVVCGVTSIDGVETGVVYILDFTKEEPVAKHEIHEDIIYDCDYLSDGSVCAIGRGGAYICNDDSFENISKISFNEMPLAVYDLNCDIGVAAFVLSRSGDGNNCSIMYVNDSGEVENTIETSHKIRSVSLYKDRIAVSDSSNIYLYNIGGELLESWEFASAEQIRLHTADGMYVLGLNEISGVAR